jgi:ketosteroid isomerase-like protein
VELVRSIFAAWERGDFSSSEWADPDIEFVRIDGPAPGRWKGSAEIAGGIREMLSAWKEFRLIADEYHELDGNRVLVLDHVIARGKRSGVDASHLRANAANLFHIAGEKVTRIVTYYDRQRALAELGVAQRPDPHALLADGRLDVEAFLSLLSDEVVWDLSRSPFVRRGIEGVRDWFCGLDDAFGDVRYEVEGVREAGGQLGMLLRVHGRGPSSQIAVEYRFVPVMTFRNGKIVRMDRYDDWAAATRAMGLSE